MQMISRRQKSRQNVKIVILTSCTRVVLHTSCKTTFAIPDRVHGNPGRVRKPEASGPVNAHLIAGPGIYFNAFIHVYSPRAGADNPLVTKVDANRNPISLCPFVAGLKTNCFVI